MERVSGEFGLKLNKEKSYCVIFNGNIDKAESVGGVKVVGGYKYLGVEVEASGDCFRNNRRGKMELAERMSNVTYSVISRACERMYIGKVFWKSVVLPRVMSSAAVIGWNVKEIEKMQRIENEVWRKILGAPGYTAVAALQGEVGCSSVYARDAKTKLLFLKFVSSSNNRIVRRIGESMKQTGKGGVWLKVVHRYMREMNITWDDIERESVQEIKQRIDNWETQRWRAEVEEKVTLQYYREKQSIGGEICYDNSWGAVLLFRTRSNTLRLGWRARYWGESVACGVCGAREETLEHFLMGCDRYEHVRVKYGIRTMKDVLDFGGDGERSKRFLEEAWSIRGRVLAESLREAN